MALSKAERAMVARIKKTREVFAYFGVETYGYDPGVIGRTSSGASIDFEEGVLRWLEPLLIELRERREGKMK